MLPATCSAHVAAHAVLRKDGSYHLDVKGVSGTAASGNTYTQRGVSVQNDSYNAGQNPGTFTFSIQFVGDNGCSFSVTYVYHITYPNDGETRSVTFEKEFVRCMD